MAAVPPLNPFLHIARLEQPPQPFEDIEGPIEALRQWATPENILRLQQARERFFAEQARAHGARNTQKIN